MLLQKKLSNHEPTYIQTIQTEAIKSGIRNASSTYLLIYTLTTLTKNVGFNFDGVFELYLKKTKDFPRIFTDIITKFPIPETIINFPQKDINFVQILCRFKINNLRRQDYSKGK